MVSSSYQDLYSLALSRRRKLGVGKMTQGIVHRHAVSVKLKQFTEKQAVPVVTNEKSGPPQPFSSNVFKARGAEDKMVYQNQNRVAKKARDIRVILCSYSLHQTNIPVAVSVIPTEDREWFTEWGEERFIEDVFVAQALCYWVRTRQMAVEEREMPMGVYKVLCMHIAMKWLGYDEIYDINFLRDLRSEMGDITSTEHLETEIKILRFLQWKL
jgi:hypothetical protein